MSERANHHMVTLARDVRAVTQEELAYRLRIGQGTLSKYENGVLDIPDDFVPSLGRELDSQRSSSISQGSLTVFRRFTIVSARSCRQSR